MLTSTEIITRLLLAFLLGGLIGFERELHGRVAGLRTHMLVCVGSTLLMLTGMYLFYQNRDTASIDPTRIAAGVVTGIGFLGAGTIMRFRASIRGLTTAASLWTVTGIGLAIGSGFCFGAAVSSVLVLVVLLLLSKVEKTLIHKDRFKILSVETVGNAQQLKDIRAVLAEYSVEIKDIEIKKQSEGTNVIIEFELKLIANSDNDQIISRTMHIQGVECASWKEW